MISLIVVLTERERAIRMLLTTKEQNYSKQIDPRMHDFKMHLWNVMDFMFFIQGNQDVVCKLRNLVQSKIVDYKLFQLPELTELKIINEKIIEEITCLKKHITYIFHMKTVDLCMISRQCLNNNNAMMMRINENRLTSMLVSMYNKKQNHWKKMFWTKKDLGKSEFQKSHINFLARSIVSITSNGLRVPLCVGKDFDPMDQERCLSTNGIKSGKSLSYRTIVEALNQFTFLKHVGFVTCTTKEHRLFCDEYDIKVKENSVAISRIINGMSRFTKKHLESINVCGDGSSVILDELMKVEDSKTNVPSFPNINSLCFHSTDMDFIPFHIPESLTNLTITNSIIGDVIPKNVFVDYKCLSSLNLSENGIRRMMPSHMQLHSLTNLQLNDNELWEMPCLDHLPKLSNLKLTSNGITEINIPTTPHENIRILDLEDNLIDEIPVDASIFLPNLNQFNLCNNNVSDLPSTKHTRGFRHLEILNLSDNDIHGTCTNVVPNISRIDISNNPLVDWLSEEEIKILPSCYIVS
jgi:hypothetical protein